MRKPSWRLIVDGVDVGPKVNHRLLSLSLTEKRGADADELTLELSDHDGRLNVPPVGAIISLALGWVDAATGDVLLMVDKGAFKIDERDHQGAPDKLSIKARSADLTGAFRRRRSTSWSGKTLGQVLADVAGRNSLEVVVDQALATRALPYIAQDRESDAAFLARLGRRFDAVATVKGGKLLFGRPGRGVNPAGQALERITITRRDGDQHKWSEAARGSYSGVIAKWRDRAGAATQEVVVGSEQNAKRLGPIYASEDAARTAAQAESDKVARGKAEFSLTLARGRPELCPERPVTVKGFKPQIDAAGWSIVETTHAIDAQGGLTTSLKCELGASASDASSPGATGT